jgi:hypothetical protein
VWRRLTAKERVRKVLSSQYGNVERYSLAAWKNKARGITTPGFLEITEPKSDGILLSSLFVIHII